MSKDTSERDWKVFRQLQAIALERFSERVLFEAARLAGSSDTSAHERYLQLYRLIDDRDQELAAAFDTPRRSAACEQLARMRSLDLITDEEFAAFSPEMRESVDILRRLLPR